MSAPGVFIAVNPTDEQVASIESGIRAWELKAARGECSWICGYCSQTFYEGMPNACPWGHQSCTDIIQRDKEEANRGR